eukprot:2798646-Prymnesium_polylepis.1
MPDQLRKYVSSPPKERKAGSKKKGGAGAFRWAGRALIDVAELVWRHGTELRRAMKGAEDDMPSAAEELERCFPHD